MRGENLVGVGGNDSIQRELPRRLAAQLEQQAGAVAGVGVDHVDEAEPRRAVQMWMLSVTDVSATCSSPEGRLLGDRGST